MSKLLKHASLLLAGFCLTACNLPVLSIPSPTATPTRYRSPVPTRTRYHTWTPLPTFTSFPSRTPTPTIPPMPPLSGRLLLLTGVTQLRWLDFDGDSATLASHGD